MTLSSLLDSALSGLSAAQAQMRSASANIANAGVAGYARERVSLETAVTQGDVAGVRYGVAQRVADRFLTDNAMRRSGDAGAAEVRAAYLDRAQSALGRPGDAGSLTGRIDAVMTSAIALSAQPASAAHQSALLGAISDAQGAITSQQSSFVRLTADVRSDAQSTAGRITALLGRIDRLNDDVVRARTLGQASAGSENQRQAALDEIAGLISVTQTIQPDGRIQLAASNGAVLLDHEPRSLVEQAPGGRFAVVRSDGSAEAGLLETSGIGGRLGGLLGLYNADLPGFSADLSALAADFTTQLSAISSANGGSLTNGGAANSIAEWLGAGNPAAGFVGAVGSAAAEASEAAAITAERRADSIQRRDDLQGVNIDEEMASMVQLQASYAASARVMNTVAEMMDELIAMAR